MAYCTKCASEIEQWDTGFYTRDLLCHVCYDARKEIARRGLCVGCSSFAKKNDRHVIKGHFYCDECFDREMGEIAQRSCIMCKKELEGYMPRKTAPRGGVVCMACYSVEVKKAGDRMRIQNKPAQNNKEFDASFGYAQDVGTGKWVFEPAPNPTGGRRRGGVIGVVNAIFGRK
ncbi:hypothetical protein FJZ26_03170 [Candidatus Parvarchaeota archaeon]|nr:hypothetical protein [Candidatus Parvarchaeota archaeon]